MRLMAVTAALVLTVSVSTAAAALETPEEAVREYLAGVADADITRVLGVSAADEVAESSRFDLQADGYGTFSIAFPSPAHDPFFAGILRARLTDGLLSRTRLLAFSLLAPDTLETVIDLLPIYDVDGDWATDLMAELDTARLASLEVVDIAQPESDYGPVGTASYHMNHARRDGADERTELVALVEFENDHYMVGFTLLRFGDRWLVLEQESTLSGLPIGGAAEPTTPEEFEELTSG